jgi:phosphoserine phosphatase
MQFCYDALMEKPRLIIFDLNKTLIEENSWLELNLAMGVTQAEDDMLTSWGRDGIISDAQGQTILCSIYRTRGEPTRSNIDRVLHNYNYLPEARETVAELGRLGYELALISGSMDVLTQHVAEELGIPHWASNNRFIFDDDDRLVSIETEDNDKGYKLHQMERLCGELGIGVEQAMPVGDGANDTLLFEASGNGVTFEDSPYAGQARHTISSLGGLIELLS